MTDKQKRVFDDWAKTLFCPIGVYMKNSTTMVIAAEKAQIVINNRDKLIKLWKTEFNIELTVLVLSLDHMYWRR